MNYYFKDTIQPKLKESRYPKMKADFVAELKKGIQDRDSLVRLNDAFYSLKAVAKTELTSPTGELLAIYRAFKDALDAGAKLNDDKAQEVREKLQAAKKNEFIDQISPQEDATANSLALTYINQLYTMHGQDSRKNALYNTALQSRQGALALLRLPCDMLPSEFRKRALAASKSSEKQAADAKQEKEIHALEETLAQAIMSGFHIRNVRDRVASKYDAMRLEAADIENT